MSFKPYLEGKLASIFVLLIGVFVFMPVMEVAAYVTIHRSYLATDSNHLVFNGDEAGSQFGSALTSGDINGDNIDDLVVGSPFYSFDKRTWMGKVSVFFGEGAATGTAAGTATLKEPDLTFYGRATGDQLGISLAAGDFNNDGIDDLAMGSYNAGTEVYRPGRVYLVLGKKDWEKKDWTFATKPANFEFVGKDNGDMYGLSIAFVDINGDNYDDLVVGAPFATTNGIGKTGVVYGYYGGQYRVYRVDSATKFFYEDGANLVLWGQSSGERFGSTLMMGNFIGTSEPDLAVSAYFANGSNGAVQAGKVYLFKLGTQYSKNYNTPDGVLMGDKTGQWLGFTLAKFSDASDASQVILYDNLAISSFPYNNRQQTGKVYVVKGNTEFNDFVVTKDSSNLYFEGGTSDNLLGASLGSGDFNKDGISDFFIGAPGVSLTKSQEEGEMYIFYGDLLKSRESFLVDKYDASSFIYGENADDWFGARATTIDFNGDGYDDIAVSSRYADSLDPNTGMIGSSNIGKVYVLFGGTTEIGRQVVVREKSDDYITRGEFIKQVVDKFDIKNKRADFINNCYEFREFCFYVFSSQSKFSNMTLEPEIVLYPDVGVNNPYYEAVTIGTMLGVVNGFDGQPETPFKPGALITRIQALKVVLAINQLVQPIYKFELTTLLGDQNALQNQKSYFQDINPKISRMWWYPMFANFAYTNALVEKSKWFRPEDYLTQGELDDMIDKTLEYMNKAAEDAVDGVDETGSNNLNLPQ